MSQCPSKTEREGYHWPCIRGAGHTGLHRSIGYGYKTDPESNDGDRLWEVYWSDPRPVKK